MSSTETPKHLKIRATTAEDYAKLVAVESALQLELANFVSPSSSPSSLSASVLVVELSLFYFSDERVV